jgi:hypothetical protein
MPQDIIVVNLPSSNNTKSNEEKATTMIDVEREKSTNATGFLFQSNMY